MNRRDILKGLGLGAVATTGAVSLPLVADETKSSPIIQIDKAKGKKGTLPVSVGAGALDQYDGAAKYWNVKVDDIIMLAENIDLEAFNTQVAQAFTDWGWLVVNTKVEKSVDYFATFAKGLVYQPRELMNKDLELEIEAHTKLSDATYDEISNYLDGKVWHRDRRFTHPNLILHTYHINQRLKHDFWDTRSEIS